MIKDKDKPTSQSKKIKDMNLEEKREYNRAKKCLYRRVETAEEKRERNKANAKGMKAKRTRETVKHKEERKKGPRGT